MPVHAKHGASSAHMWMACPGSLNLIDTLPEAVRNATSEYAIEGTHAHTLGDHCLQADGDPLRMVGVKMEDHDGSFEVSEDMAEAVQTYVDEVRMWLTQLHVKDVPAKLRTEIKFELHQRLGVEVPLFGTNDALIFQTAMRGGTLVVLDYKHGAGVPVEVMGNPQLRYYALGALFWLESQGIRVGEIYIGIVQPRCEHRDGPCRYERITPFELYEWAHELLDAVAATQPKDAPLVPSEVPGTGQCKFCPASGRCPAQLEHAQAIAQVEFSTIEEPDIEQVKAEVAAMSIAELDELAPKVALVQEWCSAVNDAIANALRAGEESTQRKLVPTRPTRKWKDEDQVVAAAVNIFGLPEDQVYLPRKVKSPAQLEKLLPKDERGLLASYYHKVSSGTKVVPIDAPGEALKVGAADEFQALEAK